MSTWPWFKTNGILFWDRCPILVYSKNENVHWGHDLGFDPWPHQTSFSSLHLQFAAILQVHLGPFVNRLQWGGLTKRNRTRQIMEQQVPPPSESSLPNVLAELYQKFDAFFCHTSCLQFGSHWVYLFLRVPFLGWFEKGFTRGITHCHGFLFSTLALQAKLSPSCKGHTGG